MILSDENSAPTKAGYSQHYYGRKKSWSEVPRDGAHPKVYVEKGGHPSSFISGNDYTIKWTNSEEYSIEAPGNQKWLRFRGRWGETTGEAPSPEGPVFRHSHSTLLNPFTPTAYMWPDPIYWSDVV